MAEKRIETEEYKGAGNIGNAWAKYTAVWPIAALVSLPFSISAMKDLFNASTHEEVAAAAKSGNKKILGGLIASLTVSIAGAVWGWRQSSKAQEQHKELQETVRDLRIENEKLASDKKWADRVNERKDQMVTQSR